MANASVLRLVAGLGNPGKEYARTRHNVGFLVLDELARRAAMAFRFEPKWNAEAAQCGGRMLMKPQTFMNLSGEAISSYARYYRLEPEETLVVLDDVALPLGQLRMRKSGSAGGHNGLESVLVHFATEGVPRLRVGVGAATEGQALSRHVLGGFRPEEEKQLEEIIALAADAVEYANGHGIDSAMNVYNKKPSV